jgi:hypothetical protein
MSLTGQELKKITEIHAREVYLKIYNFDFRL